MIALFASLISIAAVWFVPMAMQLLAGLFDMVILAGFITSAVLLSGNYHSDGARNPLRGWLIYLRLRADDSARAARSSALVKLLDACVILLILMFFATALLSFWLALLGLEKERRYAPAAVTEVREVRRDRRVPHDEESSSGL